MARKREPKRASNGEILGSKLIHDESGKLIGSIPPSKEVSRELGARSQIVKDERAEKRKTFREIFDDLLPMPCLAVDEYAAWIIENYEGVTYQQAISLAMIKRAIMGDVSAAIFIRDTVGESPKTVIGLDSDKETEINIRVVGADGK